MREDQQPVSAPPTPYSYSKEKLRGWFLSGSFTALPSPNLSTMDSGSGIKTETRQTKGVSLDQDPSRSLIREFLPPQVYGRAQKPPPMGLIHGQATRMAEGPATFQRPKMDIPMVEGKKQSPRTHNLKHCDLNVLTPTGFQNFLFQRLWVGGVLPLLPLYLGSEIGKVFVFKNLFH